MILHIMADSAKHINYPFIKFVNEHFDKNKHFFILCSTEKDIQKFENAVTKDIFHQEEFFIENMQKAKKIILHGIWYDKLCEMLLDNEEFFEKVYWEMWGGDFYFPEKQSILKKEVIKKINYLVTGTRGDYELVKKLYGTRGKHIMCFTYPSNLYKEYKVKFKGDLSINIQVGNSADSTNNHIEVLYKLIKYKNKNIKIFAPLSYGNKKYAKEVIIKGKELFGDKFIPIMQLMPFENYLEFLSKIDIAIFAPERQQAFGNIITLLGLGKKVFLNKKSVLTKLFQEYNIRIFDANNIELSPLSDFIKKDNILKVKKYYNKQVLIESLNKWIN